MIAAHVTTTAPISVASREVLFLDPYVRNVAGHHNYDVSPHGKHFVMVQHGDSATAVIVVANWLAEVRAKLAAAPRR